MPVESGRTFGNLLELHCLAAFLKMSARTMFSHDAKKRLGGAKAHLGSLELNLVVFFFCELKGCFSQL